MKKEFIAPNGEKRKRLKRAYHLENGSVKPIFKERNLTFESGCIEDVKLVKNNSKVRKENYILEIENDVGVDEDVTETDNEEFEDENIIFESNDSEDNMSLIDPHTGQMISDVTNSYSSTLLNSLDSISDSEDFEANQSPQDASDDIHESSIECSIESSTADHILHYIHKKFRKGYELDKEKASNPDQPYQPDIQGVTVDPQQQHVHLNIITKPAAHYQSNYIQERYPSMLNIYQSHTSIISESL